jgi:hypothetical protein
VVSGFFLFILAYTLFSYLLFSGNDTVVRFNDSGFHDIVLDDIKLDMNENDFILA